MAKVKNWREFQDFAREVMSEFLGVELTERKLPKVPKEFDMVSADGEYVGDAKYLTLVRGTKTPPAKFMEIAGHVWLLEKVDARRRFLVFGNQRQVPERWLQKYGSLDKDTEFYFLGQEGTPQRLN